MFFCFFFFFSSRRRHTRFSRDWSSDVCSSDLILIALLVACLTPLLITLRSERGDRKVGMLSLTSLLLFLFGMLSVWQVSVFRTYVSPWHASFALYCWLSILGLSLANLGGTAGGAAKWARAGLVVAIGSIATIGVLYLR